MVPNKFALVAVAAACVTAAGAGSYIATRQNTVGVAAADKAAGAQQASPAVTGAEARPQTVADSSAVPLAASAAPAKAAAPPPAPASVPQARARTEVAAAPPAAPAHSTSSHVEPAPEATAPPTTAAAPVLSPADQPAVVAQADDRPTDARPAEPVRTPEPPTRRYAELTVPEDAVIGLQSETSVNSERARVEDRVEARVVRDVLVDGYVAVPAGTRAIGSVTVVDRGGRFRDRARLGIRFHTLVLADGTRLSISTDPIYRYGDPPSDKSAAKIGAGAAAGAILGAIIGGGKGAAIGATAGAGAGTATVMAAERGSATFPAGVEVTARIASPLSVTVERE
jgi:hypothetical protein